MSDTYALRVKTSYSFHTDDLQVVCTVRNTVLELDVQRPDDEWPLYNTIIVYGMTPEDYERVARAGAEGYERLTGSPLEL